MHDRYETSSRGDDCRCRRGARCAECMGLRELLARLLDDGERGYHEHHARLSAHGPRKLP